MVMQKLESLAVITARSEHILEEKDKLKIFIIRFGLVNFLYFLDLMLEISNDTYNEHY